MSILEELKQRSGGVCELCGSEHNLSAYEVSPSDGTVEQTILVCGKCLEGLNDDAKLDENHFRCLGDSMWSAVPAVQVVVYRTLKKMGNFDLLDQMYLDPEVQSYADASASGSNSDGIVFKDAYGAVLNAGDTVTIIKDLDVKGANFVAKRGTAVRNISLTDDPEHIEGKVNGTKIYLKTCFLKKS